MNKNDEGVSPVIGVILMVAITVVLAAVVFILVTNLSTGVEEPLTLGVIRESDDSFTITKTSSVISYDDLIVRDNGVVVNYTVNGSVPSPDTDLSTGDNIVITPLQSGPHRVHFVVGNQIVFSSTFSN